MGDDKRGTRIDIGLGGLFKGLGDLVDSLSELAEKGRDLRQEGSFESGKGVQGVYGFHVKVGGLGGRDVQVEPFGNVRRDPGGRATVADEREPLVDVLDESDHLSVVFELPGVAEGEVELELAGDVLTLQTTGEGRRYRKELLLPQAFDAGAMTSALQNGVLEVRFAKGVG